MHSSALSRVQDFEAHFNVISVSLHQFSPFHMDQGTFHFVHPVLVVLQILLISRTRDLPVPETSCQYGSFSG